MTHVIELIGQVPRGLLIGWLIFGAGLFVLVVLWLATAPPRGRRRKPLVAPQAVRAVRWVGKPPRGAQAPVRRARRASGRHALNNPDSTHVGIPAAEILAMLRPPEVRRHDGSARNDNTDVHTFVKDPRTVVQEWLMEPPSSVAGFDTSRDGTAALVWPDAVEPPERPRRLVWAEAAEAARLRAERGLDKRA